MRRIPKLLLAVVLTAVVTAAAAPSAGAKVPGPNGRIVFGRFDPAIDDFHIFTADPDGTREAQLLPGAAECPRWAPDGSKVLVCLANPAGLIRPATVNPQGSGFRLLDNPDPTLNLGCWAWSPNGARLACEGWDDVNVDQSAGIFTVRSSDGRGLVRLTANPYGDHDVPGDYAPDGSRIVFLRSNPDRQASALFVVNTDGTGLRQLTPWGLAEDAGSWSPDGRWILFTKPGGKLYVVRPDGSGLRRILLDTGPGRSFAFQPGWSPNGKRIVFSMALQSAGYQEDIFTARADGTDLRRVTNTPDTEEFGDWGPSRG
jgi:Tol biopolymer transport system component